MWSVTNNNAKALFCLKANGPSCNRVFVEMYSLTKFITGYGLASQLLSKVDQTN